MNTKRTQNMTDVSLKRIIVIRHEKSQDTH